MQAVLDGVGVAIAQLPYVSDALAAGQLVSPFPIVEQEYEKWYFAFRHSPEAPGAIDFPRMAHAEGYSATPNISRDGFY